MNQERPAPQLQRPDEGDSREHNGTGEGADEDELGTTEEELNDLEDDAEGG